MMRRPVVIAAVAAVVAIVVVTIIAVAVSGSSEAPENGCNFNVNSGQLPSPEPLFLLPSGPLDVNGYLLPDGSGNVHLDPGDEILVACPGQKVGAFGAEVIAECRAGTTFVVRDKTRDKAVPLQELACSAHPTHNASDSGALCGENGRGRLLEIGHTTARGFVVLMRTCFLDSTLEVLYAMSIVSGSIGGSRRNVSRPEFVTGGDFYGKVNPNSHYVRGGQWAAFAEILGSEALASHYIANASTNSDYYLARGHLVAKADFVWAQQQRATFYYVNAAPQWQTFNGGNWERLESSVRQLAATRARDLLVVTGTWDRAHLHDVYYNISELFINAQGLIPVPALYWKVVYDESTREGAAFVGVNNPYTRLEADPRLLLCPDVCAAIDWVSWAPDSVQAGEGYCCEVDALRRAVPDMPNLKVSALLSRA